MPNSGDLAFLNALRFVPTYVRVASVTDFSDDKSILSITLINGEIFSFSCLSTFAHSWVSTLGQAKKSVVKRDVTVNLYA